MKIKLGYELKTGKEISIPKGHMIVTGITQKSGKTTTMESLIKRDKGKFIVFRTKRGETSFLDGKIIQPFFKDRSDWTFVQSIIEAVLKNKITYFEKTQVIKICNKSQNSLFEFKKIVDDKLNNKSTKKLSQFEENILINLQAYLKEVLPKLENIPFTDKLELSNGLNIIDLEEYHDDDALLSLIISSVVTEVLDKKENTTIVIPEAWKFIPEGMNNPSKLPIEKFIRQGATNNNFIWIDSMPDYEVIMTKINGQIKPMRFSEIFNLEGILETTYVVKEIKGTGLLQKVQHDIKTITEDIEVLDSDSSHLRWYKLNKVFRHKYAGEILSINTLDGVIDVSPNHPILVQKRGAPTVEAWRLKLGDKLISRRPEPKNRFHNNKSLFVGTTDLAWFLGFFCAEGWVHDNHICLSNKDRVLLEKAKTIINNTFHRSAVILKPRKNVFTLDCCSPNLTKYFKKTCYCNVNYYDSTTKAVPLSILNGHKKLKKAFLDGYLTGDGSFNKERERWTFTSTSRSLILGIIECFNTVYSTANYTLHIRDDKPDVIQVNVNKTTNRKLERDRVKKISRKPYYGWLYDIEVDSPDHTFYMGINNIKVHNSQDIAGVSKTILKQVTEWILGYQAEINEVKHTLVQLPLSKEQKPKPEEIMNLGTGEFYYASRDLKAHLFVQSWWVNDQLAQEVALGKITVNDLPDKPKQKKNSGDYKTRTPIETKTETKLSDETLTYIDEQIGRVLREINEIKQQNKKPIIDVDAIVKQVLAKIPQDGNIINQVEPLEKIKETFLLDAKNKISDDISNLSQQAKKMLKYLETRGVGVPVNELCIKCFLMKSGSGSYSTQVNSFGRELVDILVAEKERNGRFKGLLKKRLMDLLQVHDATSEQIENVYKHVLMDLLSEKVKA